MAKKLYDLAVATRRYTDRDGKEKSVWENVGAILQADGEPYMMLKAHFLPAAIQRKEGSESILVSLFLPKDSMPDAGFSYDTTAGHRLYDLAVAVRRWENQQGEKKTSWFNAGAIIQGKDSRPYMMLKAHFNPAGVVRKEGSESILVSLFKPKQQDCYSSAGDFAAQSFDEDSIPF